MSDAHYIDLISREGMQCPNANRIFDCTLFSAEHVRIATNSPYDYRYCGDRNYLALHDIIRSDGESFVDNACHAHVKDIRNRMTFIPAGCMVHGWTAPVQRSNSFTALYFDPQSVFNHLGTKSSDAPPRPNMYFEDNALIQTMWKIDGLLRGNNVPDRLYMETLGLSAAIEIHRMSEQAFPATLKASGQLSQRQMQRVMELVDAHLEIDISLDDLAEAAGLSPFHFTRLFKNTTGVAPYQYVLRLRIERSQEMLRRKDLSIAKVAAAVGFKGAVQFNRNFRKLTGSTPSEYRKSLSA